MARHAHVAFDLGAESGRAMLAVLEGDHLQLEPVHRFANMPQQLPDGLHWSLMELWRQMVEGLGRCARRAGEQDLELVSLGVDAWGVDFGLIGRSGQLLGLPHAYRDPRNGPAYEKLIAALGKKAIYDATGVQFMPFNSLVQLLAQHDAEPGTLEQAGHMLFISDLMHYFFTGQARNEATIASTSQMVDPHTGRWAVELLSRLGLSSGFLSDDIVDAGTVVGTLRRPVARSAGMEPIEVITPASHDTASAIAAVPADTAGPPWAYLSSGTWSLMGAELDGPVVTDAACRANFTNERGVSGTIRFLRNIAGLWLVQELRRDFAGRGQNHDYEKLTALAESASPFRTLIDPAHGPFAAPGQMAAKISEFAQTTAQPPPEDPGQFVRCCLESLALTYRRTLDDLEVLLHQRFELLHIVGGGSRNRLLNQMTADAIGRPVIAGPTEATAIGNALTQAMGTANVRDLSHLRCIVRASFELEAFEPRSANDFEAQMDRYKSLSS